MKIKRFMTLLGLIFLSGLIIFYSLIWAKKSFVLDKGEMTPELAQEYDHCEKITEEISRKVAIPDETLTAGRKAISCDIRLSFTMRKYKQIKVYGVVDQSNQKTIEQVIQQNIGTDLPIELLIYEKENWKQVGTSHERQEESLIFKRWIRAQ